MTSIRPNKTPRTVIFLRAVAIVWAILWGFFHILPFEGYYYVKIWSTWWFPLLLSVALVLRVGVVSYVIDMIFYGLLMGNDPAYQEARRGGWHPFWDNIPSPINPDNSFEPPTNWQFFCPVCNSRVEKAKDVCWNCGYGADGDSTAYYERYGYPPSDPPSDNGPAPSIPVSEG